MSQDAAKRDSLMKTEGARIVQEGNKRSLHPRFAEILEDQPKTMAWKLRARVGTKTKWYKDVEEVTR